MAVLTKTKIVATIGPASWSHAVLERLIQTGVDAVRFNMSHGLHEEHQQALHALREVLRGRDKHVATIADLCGPKIRTGAIDPQESHLGSGETCNIVRDPIEGTARQFSTNHPQIVDDVDVGHRLLIDDGLLRLRVADKRRDALVCVCEVGGEVGSKKGINVPDSHLSLPPLSEKDQADAKWAAVNGFDYVAQSFVREPDDIHKLRAFLHDTGMDIPIIAKIETPQAINALEAIIDAADAVLVARGDLGVEMDVWRIPTLQKDIVRRCRHMGKSVIVATQMLQSMVDHPTPTRAEVSDVANAVLDGADAVMLSAESALGSYPIEAVTMLNRIAQQTESDRWHAGGRRSDVFDEALRVGHKIDRTAAAVARSAVLVGHDMGAKLLAVWCRSGRTAGWISKYHPPQVLVALCPTDTMCRRMALSRGVEPMLVASELAQGAASSSGLRGRIAVKYGLMAGDMLVVVGDPAQPERTSTLSIHAVSSDKG